MGKETGNKAKRSLMFWFIFIFMFFAVTVLAATGVSTYFAEMRSYKATCENNIRHVGEYLTVLINDNAETFEEYQKYYMDHYRDMEVPYDFTEFRTAQYEFYEAFQKEYPGRTFGGDITVDDLSEETANKYYASQHEYFLLLFEQAKEKFDLAYVYYLVMGDDRARIEGLAEEGQADPEHNVLYMIDGERTLDEEKSKEAGRDILYLGDTYYNSRNFNSIMWITWETGIKQKGFKEWDNEWGHTYGCYTPLIINGEKMGLIVTEIDVQKVNKEILRNTLLQMKDVAIILGVCLMLMILLVRIRFINRIVNLQKAVAEYAESRDASIADQLEANYRGGTEIDALGRQTSAMIKDISGYMSNLLSTTMQLRNSKRREHELSEQVIMDSLSGVRDNTAYDREVFKLTHAITRGEAEFALVMAQIIDVDKLTEKFGQMKADMAIRKICHQLTVVFAESSIYRTEKDEFVLILKGEDKDNAADLVDCFNEGLLRAIEDETLEEWEAVPTAVGLAIYDEEKDARSFQNVYKRAQSAMLKHKDSLQMG